MSRRFVLLAAALTALATTPQPSAAKSPPTPEKATRQCFWAKDVNGFASRDSKIVNVRVGIKDVYELQMLGSCPDVRWNKAIAIRSRAGSTICTGLDADIISPSSIGPQNCPVKAVRKLTPAEIEALPKGARP
jgi:hypothetical protein